MMFRPNLRQRLSGSDDSYSTMLYNGMKWRENMSIHIGAPEGAIAPRVLLPGDPLRAKFIAENYLENFQCL